MSADKIAIDPVLLAGAAIGPLGVKGIGEPAMVPTIPAIMNAIYDAVGVRITELPATPEKVLMALKARERVESERRAAAQAAE